MDNLEIYKALKEVPKEALKEIVGGRLKGMSDINPMWRIKALTEQFGPCGQGWRYVVTNQRTIEGADGSIAAFVDILLYYKVGDVWSEPVPGIGGSMFITKESKGLYTDDECFKKALTDAIGVAGKALGLAASIYWQNDRTKYSNPDPKPVADVIAEPPGEKLSQEEVKQELGIVAGGGGVEDKKATFQKAKELFDKPEAKDPDGVDAQRSAIKAMIMELAGEDENVAKDMLEELTTFEGSKGTVKGKRSTAQLSEKQVPVVYGKVKKLYEERGVGLSQNEFEQAVNTIDLDSE